MALSIPGPLESLVSIQVTGERKVEEILDAYDSGPGNNTSAPLSEWSQGHLWMQGRLGNVIPKWAMYPPQD